MTIQELTQDYAIEHEALARKSDAWRYISRDVLNFFGDVALTEAMKPATVAQYLGHCRAKGNAEQTLASKLAFLRSLCRLSTEAGYPVAFPRRLAASIKVDNARERVLSEKELNAIQRELHAEDWEALRFFLMTGLRRQEAANLRVADCHFGLGQMTIRITKTGKGRTIPMIGWVRDYCARAAKAKREFVVKFRDFMHYKCRISACRAWQDIVLRPALRRAKVVDWRLHDSRHQCTTDLIEGGANTMAVTEIMGWKSGTYVKRYTNLRMKSLQQAMSVLEKPKTRRGRSQ